MARAYRMSARAARQEVTRRRIVEAAVELHRTLGPARTEISAVADLAGVDRGTVYRHFPQTEALLAACSQHFRTANPLPLVGAFARIRDPSLRARAALEAAYAYYARNEPMMAAVLRDSAVMPVGAGFRRFQEEMARCLVRGWGVRGRRRAVLDAAARLAVDFHAWRLLELEHGLRREDVVAMMLGTIARAGDAGARPPG